MLDIKRKTPLIAFVGAVALMVSAPAFAQDAAAPAPATTEAAAPAATPAPAAAPAEEPVDAGVAATEKMKAHSLTPIGMFMSAQAVVKVVMIGLILASVFSWVLLITKLFEFGALNKQSDKFLEAFRGARSIADILRIGSSEEFEGNPLADMAEIGRASCRERVYVLV